MEQKFYKTYKITQLKFWQNFWEYYKIHMFLIVLCAALLIVGVRSCANRITPDLYITYIGGMELFSSQKTDEFLKDKINDIDSDGENVIVISMHALAEDELLEETVMILNRIDAELIAGDPFILAADDEFIYRFVNMSALQPITEIAKEFDVAEENVLRDPNSSEIVAIDISEMPISEQIGAIKGEKLYIGMKVLPYSKMYNEKYMTRHNQTLYAIKALLENK